MRKNPKIYMIAMDGAADRRILRLGGRTPLEAAETPYLDRLAENGRQSLIEILPKGLTPESDSGAMALLGYDPIMYYCGRGALECMGLETYKDFQSFAGFRVNFASLDSITGQLDRRTARGLAGEELAALTDEITRKVKLTAVPEVQFQLLSFGTHRGILGFYSNSVELSGNVSNTDPGFHKKGYFSLPVKEYPALLQRCVPLDDTDAAVSTAALVNDFTAQCNHILNCSPVNLNRQQEGKLPANCLLLRDGGSKHRTMPSIQEKYHRFASIYGQLPCERALAELIGAQFYYTQALELQLEAAYLSQTARRLLKDPSDIVFCHLKGPDEPGHDNDPFGKQRAIEQIDQFFFRELVTGAGNGDVIIVTCDHATPCELGIHSDDKVPVLLSGSRIKPDGNQRFNEISAAQGGTGRAVDILRYVCEVIDHE